MATGWKGCFIVLLTRELALRFGFDMAAARACLHMGHQLVASPTVRYILHGERNRLVAEHKLSWIK